MKRAQFMYLTRYTKASRRGKKKTGAVDYPQVFHHADLLVNEPPATGELPFG
jgi:hypothetical protein